jgi:hypothetical protein
MKSFALAMAILLSMAGAPHAAHAEGAETLHFKFKGAFAEAVFNSVSGCVETSVFVFAQSDQRERTSEAIVELFQTDTCSGALLASAIGVAALAPDQFQIDNHLDAATLNANFEATDFVSSSTVAVNVSVSWSGSGDIVRTTDHFQLKEPGLKRNAHFNGAVRSATASGAVASGIVSFTSQPATFADMGSIRQGSVSISH